MKAVIFILSILSFITLLIGFDFVIQHYPYCHFMPYGSLAGFATAIFLATKLKK